MNSADLYQQWTDEVYAMRDRIRSMRQKLYDALSTKMPNKDFSYFIKQRGMFSFTGLSPAQVERLQKKHAIYLVGSGRICIAGLNTRNIDYVANAFAEVFQ